MPITARFKNILASNQPLEAGDIEAALWPIIQSGRVRGMPSLIDVSIASNENDMRTPFDIADEVHRTAMRMANMSGWKFTVIVHEESNRRICARAQYPNPDALTLAIDNAFDDPCAGVSPMPVVPLVLRLEWSGAELAIAKRSVIGRHPKCDIVVEHDDVSRHHAQLSPVREGLWLLSDLGSTCGTSIKGPDETHFIEVTNKPVIVESGSVISLGDFTRIEVL